MHATARNPRQPRPAPRGAAPRPARRPSPGTPRLLACALAVCVAAVLSAWTVAAQQPGVHPVSGRVFAQPMGVQGAPWLERDERQEEEEPDRALRILKIPKGAAVADVGA